MERFAIEAIVEPPFGGACRGQALEGQPPCSFLVAPIEEILRERSRPFGQLSRWRRLGACFSLRRVRNRNDRPCISLLARDGFAPWARIARSALSR
jgi:hypothetical protein